MDLFPGWPAALEVGTARRVALDTDDQGKPSGMFTAEEAARFDEASLRQILRKWIPDPFDIQVAQHEVQQQPVVLIHIAPIPHGLCIFRRDGEYADPRPDDESQPTRSRAVSEALQIVPSP